MGAQVFGAADFCVSTHSRLKAAGPHTDNGRGYVRVSTHSRLKAAGFGFYIVQFTRNGFNTQPPEGGWQ